MRRGKRVRGELSVDYLISGFRISIGNQSTTTGPRTHITGIARAWTRAHIEVRVFLVSSVPLLGGFSRITESSYVGASSLKVWVADFVRLGASLWAGFSLWTSRLTSPAPTLIVERSGVLQSLSSFHPHKRRAVRVVEANGLYSRETVLDRNVLKSEMLACAIERHVFRSADLVVAVSENLKREIISFAGISEDAVLVVPNGVDASLSRVAREATRKCIIGFVGALSAWQHLDRMIEVYSECRIKLAEEAGVEVHLEIIGDGVDREKIMQLRSHLDLTGVVTLLGAMPHVDAIQAMRRWDIGFAGHERSSSSTMYHSPLKIYEYAALGLINVCTFSEDAETLRKTGVPTFWYSDSDTLRDALMCAAATFRTRSTEDVVRLRAQVAEEHSWAARAQAILGAALPASILLN